MSLRAYYIIINYCCPRLSKGALTYLCNSVLGLSTADGGNVVNREIIMEEGGEKKVMAFYPMGKNLLVLKSLMKFTDWV